MPHRDPETGQFLPHDGSRYEDIEVVTASFNTGVQAGDLDGTTGYGGEPEEFEGLQLLDYDEVVDRNESLHLLHADHRLSVIPNSTETADGTLKAAVSVSASPALSDATRTAAQANQGSFGGSAPVVGQANQDDSIDIVGRPLLAFATGPFSDGGTGVGGGGSEGGDNYSTDVFPAEYGRFHPRDELFLNGRIVTYNIDDAGVHVDGVIQHVYGVIED
jgi:hypothetical protein